MKILLISSIVPNEAAMGGPLILKRHFENPELSVRVFRESQDSSIGSKKWRSPRTRVGKAIESFRPPQPDPLEMDKEINSFQPDLILSVAHGWWFFAARDAALRHDIPLVLWCQDWWPDFPQVSSFARSFVHKRVVSACRDAALVICVSKGMHEEIGSPSNSVVLHDLPSKVSGEQVQPEIVQPYRVIYGGNIGEYGPMVGEAARACLEGGKARIDIYGGPRPGWTGEIAKVLRHAGAFHGLFRANAFLQRIRSSHAVLITQPFAEDAARRMRTCFPSKLIEMAQLHKPMIIWGPDYCSSIRWAREREAGICITTQDPKEVGRQIEGLAEDPSEHQRLSKASADAAKNDFDPDKIRNRFVELLSETSKGGH